MPLAHTVKALVVDDQASMRGIVRQHLKTLGVTNVVEADNAKTALERLSQQMIHIVISDFNMEGGDGLVLLKGIRSHPVLKRIPVIMVTGNSESSVVDALIKNGVNGYLVKPVSAVALKQRMEKILGPLQLAPIA